MIEKDMVSPIEEVEDNNNRGSFFAHLLLNNTETEDIVKIAESLKEPKDKVEVELKINGKQLFVKDFNKILLDWFNQIEAKHLAHYEKLATEEGLMKKAQEIVRERLGKVDDALSNLKAYCENQMEDWGSYD